MYLHPHEWERWSWAPQTIWLCECFTHIFIKILVCVFFDSRFRMLLNDEVWALWGLRQLLCLFLLLFYGRWRSRQIGIGPFFITLRVSLQYSFSCIVHLCLSFTYLLNSPLFNTHFKIFFLTFVFFLFFVVLFSKNLCFCSYSFLCVCLLASLCFFVIHLAICTYFPGSFNMCGL